MVQVQGVDQRFVRHARPTRDLALDQADISNATAGWEADGSRDHLAPSRGNAQRVKAFGGEAKFPPALPDVATTRRDNGVESIAVVFAHAFGSMPRCEGAIDLVIDIMREEDFGADFIGKAPVTTFHGKVGVFTLFGF